jgi:tripartite-type tricarboxylate transporter receptor subunit TctC
MYIIRVMIAAVVLVLGGSALAQPYPSKPVKVLIGFAPGGTTDTVLRRIVSRLEERLGQPVVVENRPGASGTIAAAAVARADPDGHTLLFGVAANLAVAPATMKSPPYDPPTAFAPIIEIARGPYLWLVRSDAPAKTMQEFIAWSKRNPGKLNYGSPGEGSVHHLSTEMFKQAAGLDMVHVPYRAGLYLALLAGEIHAMFETMPGPLPHLEAGKIRALGVTGAQRLPVLPDVPTLAEQGVPDMDVNFWWGFVGPARMPRAVVAKLNAEIASALADPELKATFAKWAIEPTPGTPDAFGVYIRLEFARWKEVVTKSGMKLE